MAITFNHNDQVYVKDGKMGIGASDPLRNLHVVGNFAVNAGTDEYYGVYIPGNAEGSDPQILIGDWHNASATITWDSSARALNIDTQYSSGAGTFNITGNDGASTFLTVNTSGNVGIGTTNPTYKLTVQGSVNLAGSGAYLRWNSGDMQISNDGSYKMGFYTYNTTAAALVNRMVIDTSGNVGIGTTSPSDKLEVKDGSIRVTTSNSFSNLISGRSAIPNAGGYNLGGLLFQAYSTGTTYTTGAAIYSYADGAAWTSTSVPSYLSFHTTASGATSTTERMVINSSGNVGIGTTSPSRTLSVETTDTATYDSTVNASEISVARKNTSNTAGQVAAISLNATGWSGSTTGVVVLNAIQQQGNYSNADFAIQNRVGGSFVETFRITTYGDVGIGTDSPSTKLHIADDANEHLVMKLEQDNSGYQAWFEANSQDGGFARFGIGADASDFAFWNTDQSAYHWYTGSLRMVLTSGGDLGIGTSSPSYKLHVAGDAGVTGTLYSNDIEVDNGNTILINNSASAGHTTIGGVHNEAENEYIRGNITFTRNEDQITYSAANNVFVHAGGSSTDWSMIAHHSDGMRIYSGSSDSVGWSKSIADFKDDHMSIYINNSGTIQLGQYGAGYLKTDASGNISVDTDTIEDTLQSVTDRGATSSNTIEFTGSANAYVGIQGETDVNLKIGTGAGSEPRIYLFGSANGQSNAGNVFIGTANNTGMVDINGDVDISGFAGFNGITAPDFPVDISSVDGGKVLRSTRGTSIFRIDQSNDGPGYIGMQSADDLSIQTNNTSKMYITSAGNVGIGTTSPSYQLDVNGAANSNTEFRAPSGKFDQIKNRATGNTVIDFDASNNVGIGTTSPSEKLEVNGNVKADSFIADKGAGIYSFSDTVNASSSEDIFSISNQHGAQAFRVTFVCSTSGYSVAKTFEVVHSYGNAPVFFKVVDTGAYGTHDFDVSFTNDATDDSKVVCSITNNSTTVNANIVSTVFLGGSSTTITVTAL